MLSLNPLKAPVPHTFGGYAEAGDAPRSIFRRPRPERGEVFGASAFGCGAGVPSLQQEQAIRRLMALLAARMWRGAQNSVDGALWQERLSAARGEASTHEVWENPSIPSGYTYLLQLIAHDLVESVPSPTVLFGPQAHATSFTNARRRALLLDTIYGSGPDSCPQAYGVSARHARSKGALPRNRLRLSNVSAAAGALSPSARCPFRDIARTSVPTDGERRTLSEALIADPRNDAHALISQLTVVFHLLHNAIMDRLEAATPDLSIDQAYREFHCARLIVTLIYRNIIAHDVLPRILDPRIHALYAQGLELDDGPGIPVEFSTAAFRFGHAMVRECYSINDEAKHQPFRTALELTSRRDPARFPLDKKWLVDWQYFYGGAEHTNFSRRLGPYHSDPLVNASFFPWLTGSLAQANRATERGLALRDLLSAGFSGVWSVPALTREVRHRLKRADIDCELVPDHAAWRHSLANWLDDAPDRQSGSGSYLSRADLSQLVDDPPLPFFILFEAAHAFAEGRPREVPAPGALFPGQGGRHLGPLGSIIVAETMFGALRSRPFGFDEVTTPLLVRIRTCCQALLRDEHILDPLFAGPPITSMTGLFGLLERLRRDDDQPSPSSINTTSTEQDHAAS